MIARRDLFRHALAAVALLALPSPLRRLTTDADAGWFAAIPMPPGWAILSVQLVHAGTWAMWHVRTGRYEPAPPRGWPFWGGWESAGDPVEVLDYHGALAASSDRAARMVIEEPRDGVVRLRAWESGAC